MGFLAKHANIEQACNWLGVETGQDWALSRLLECGLVPYFWLDFTPGYPSIFGDKIEGFLSRMIFQGDICRLEGDGGDALINMFAGHDGALVQVSPPMRLPLSDLRFMREDVMELARAFKDSRAQSEGAGLEGISHPAPANTIHKIATRKRELDAEIEMANSRALKADDLNSVWTALKQMAHEGYGALVGFADGGIQYKGKKFEEIGEYDVFTKDALKGRMRRKRSGK